MLQAHLCGTQNMAGRMQGHGHAVMRDLLTIRQTLQRDALAEPGTQHAFRGRG